MLQETQIDDRAIIQALDETNKFFITTPLFGDCSCPKTYIHNHTMLMCEDCGALRDESPDSRIGEIRQAGIHIDWTHPTVKQTLEAHNLLSLQD